MSIIADMRLRSCPCSSSKIWTWSEKISHRFGLGQSNPGSLPNAGTNFRAQLARRSFVVNGYKHSERAKSGGRRRRTRTIYCWRNQAGYLLLEVLLALVVLSIIVGLVFRIIQTTSSVTSNVQFLQGQQEHSDGVYEILRKDIESLPGTAEFETKRTKDEFQLIFDETSFNFSWKGAESGFGTVILAVRNQPDGRFSLVATEIPEPPVSDAPPPPTIVTTLITGLVRCDWRFFDRNTGNWVTNWASGGDKPTLMECTFQVSGQASPVRAVFPWRVAETNTGGA